jgi:hypothetical protein|tara:strand:- start:946 stop:1446 length:501 start_codon:yes stop_codon:yes gene_type:complete
MEEINVLLDLVGEFFVEKFREEIAMQGHNNTKTLIETMRFETNGVDTIDVYMQDYAKFVDSGIRPGKKVSVYALIEWIEQKGIATGEKEVKGMAFAIRKKIEQEGSPTSNAYNFSDNGRRTGFIQLVISEQSKFVLSLIREELGTFSSGFFDNVIKTNRNIFLQNE